MAAVVGSASAIDLRAPGSFHVRFGASVTKDDGSKRYRSVRYNHKPRSAQGATVTSKLLHGKQANGIAVLLKDGDKEWRYNGRQKEDEDTYVLVLSGDGKKEVVLEKLGSTHAVNLTNTPEDKDEQRLARQHPYLSDNESDDDEGMFGDEDDAEDAEPDADNPFDFRHFLKSVEETSQREEPTSQPSRSYAGTPTQRAATNTPVQRPAEPTATNAAVKKRKTPSAAATRPNPKRVRAGEDPPSAKPPASKPTASKPAAAEIPQVRIDRKASQAKPATQPDYEDDGELILENSTDNPNQNPGHLSAMSLALSGALGSHGAGPISLRSAASSPGVNSPLPNSSAAQDKAEGEEFDLGGGSSPAAEQYEFEFVDDDGDGGEEDGQDGDVEDLELPSPTQPEEPRQPTVPSRSRRGSLAGPVGDDDDDMEAQLALAMAADDDSDEDVSEEE